MNTVQNLENHLKVKRLTIPKSKFTTLRPSNETPPCRCPLFTKSIRTTQ